MTGNHCVFCLIMGKIHDWYLGLYAIICVYFIGIRYALLEFMHDNFLQTGLKDQATKSNFYASLEEPVAVVTGGSGTIGVKLVQELLDRGFQVVSVSLNDSKLGKHHRLFNYRVDLSNPREARRVGRELTRSVGKVNLLICNAGVMLVPNKPTSLGYEPHIALHLLGHAALIKSLRSAFKMANGFCRIVFVSSCTAFCGHLNSNENHKYDIFKRYINGYYAYAKSKLALSCYAEELDLCLIKEARDGNCQPLARVCSLHPGCVPGTLYRNSCLPARLFINLILAKISRSASIAANEILFTALMDDFKGGAYYERMRATQLRPDISRAAKRRLFEQVSRILRQTES